MFATLRVMAHPPAPALIVEHADRPALRAVVRAPTSEQRAVTRARIVLRSAEGAPIERIADELGVAVMTVKLWRRRYATAGLAGLADAPRPGHPPTYTREDRDRLVALTLGPSPDGTTHWSVRRMARQTGMSPSTVHRIWAELGYKPHRTETFKFSTDPDLAAKVRDVVGLYLDPPDGAVVLCVDEKTGIQALDRTQPQLPMRPGQVERHTHDYTRNGTTCLFAALEVGTGAVTTATRERHTGGVDTHEHIHVAVALDELGGRLGELTVATDRGDAGQLERWAASHEQILACGIEPDIGDGSGQHAIVTTTAPRVNVLLRPRHGSTTTDATVAPATSSGMLSNWSGVGRSPSSTIANTVVGAPDVALIGLTTVNVSRRRPS